MDNEAAEKRLREISDQIVSLKMYLSTTPANGFMIELLEMERQAIKKDFIRCVPNP